MVEVWRARTALGPKEETSVPDAVLFHVGTTPVLPNPEDYEYTCTRYKPLQGSTTVVGGGLASAH